MIGTTAALILGGLSAAGAIGGAAIGSSGAQSAANTQAQAADKALAFQKEQWQQEQANYAPWLQSGVNALDILNAGMPYLESGFNPDSAGVPSTYGSFQAPDAFQAPAPFKFDTADLLKDPGHQFTVDQANEQIQRSAAARGGALGGGVLKALADYNTQAANQYYGDVYNRSAGTYQQNLENSRNIYQQNFGNQLSAYGANADTYYKNYSNAANTFWTNQANTYNRWANLAGMGQTATNQLGNFGSSFATNAANTTMNQGNALAAGQVGSSNAWSGGLGSGLNSLISLLAMSKWAKGQ